ncbi:hypothetical protein HPB51_005225 [Rhipicephalus microplus]|uniref:Uncharacterized protein n=1 Tax=Rhipicephalus microplus TaxID=6941 RepID=A0A9J6DZ22_RHIMP|nr:hypothetical protein HPB51_005225 [Rhipicephalus microplus]
MTPSEARKLHESKLSMEDDGPAKLANVALNLPQRTVYHWHSVWREACFGGTLIDPVLKLKKKASLYAAQERSREPHRSFGAVCAGAVEVSIASGEATDNVFVVGFVVTDGALNPTGLVVEGTSLVCVVPWLLPRFTGAFGGAVFKEGGAAEAAPPMGACGVCLGTLGAVRATAKGLCGAAPRCTTSAKGPTNEAFVPIVLTFLSPQEEWVQLYRLDVLTRGHNTNNFAEATIRVLKDIILNRVEAFNAVALLDSVALVWEKHFESHILRHAYSRVPAHQLLYKRLLSKMSKDAAEAIQVVGQRQYIVPNATHPSSSYEVYADIGLRTCLLGKEGAFCKHQALVHKKYGGLFSNAPVLNNDDRYQLGQLALGEKCPPRIFLDPSKRRSPAVVPEPRKVPVPSRRSQTSSNQCKAPAHKRPHTSHLYRRCLMRPNLPR